MSYKLLRGGEVEGFPTARTELVAKRLAEGAPAGGRTETEPPTPTVSAKLAGRTKPLSDHGLL